MASYSRCTKIMMKTTQGNPCFSNETNMQRMIIWLPTADLAFHLHKSVCLVLQQVLIVIAIQSHNKLFGNKELVVVTNFDHFLSRQALRRTCQLNWITYSFDFLISANFLKISVVLQIIWINLDF